MREIELSAGTIEYEDTGQLVEVEDSYTLIPLDQPARLAQIIREFTGPPESVIDGRQGPGLTARASTP